MALPIIEIHRHFPEHDVHGFDAAEAPALVHTKTFSRHLHEGFHIAGEDFPGSRQFFEFFFHRLDNAPPHDVAKGLA